MKEYIVYQQIVTKIETIDNIPYDREIRVLMRKVKAKNIELAIKIFTENTKQINAFRRSIIGCVEINKVLVLS